MSEPRLPATFILPNINPEPWMAPKFNRASNRTYAHPKMRVYKSAVQQEFAKRYPDWECLPKGKLLQIRFLYARSTGNGQPSDASNLTKATEDALQKILFHNDRHNHRVTSTIIEQGPSVDRVGIVIYVEEFVINALEWDIWHVQWGRVDQPKTTSLIREIDTSDDF